MKPTSLQSKPFKPTPRVTFDVFYPHPPERAWRALTDPAALARWLLPTDFRPRPGHRFQFRQHKARRGRKEQPPETVCGEVVTVEKHRCLAYTWQSERDAEPTLVTWTLEPVEGGTRLQLDHTALTGPESLTFRAEATANWQIALTVALPSALDFGQDRPRPIGLILLPHAAETVRCVSRYRLPMTLGRR